MFAEDSLWSTELLMFPPSPTSSWIEGHFDFEPGGQKVNAIRHYHLVFQEKLTASKTEIKAHGLAA